MPQAPHLPFVVAFDVLGSSSRTRQSAQVPRPGIPPCASATVQPAAPSSNWKKPRFGRKSPFVKACCRRVTLRARKGLERTACGPHGAACRQRFSQLRRSSIRSSRLAPSVLARGRRRARITDARSSGRRRPKKDPGAFAPGQNQHGDCASAQNERTTCRRPLNPSESL
jgi:hypothetical protein